MNFCLEIRHKRRITVAAASKILANLTYAYKGYGLSMGTMLAGVCAIYFFYSHGTWKLTMISR
jgi:20S proteasome subunit beta 5